MTLAKVHAVSKYWHGITLHPVLFKVIWFLINSRKENKLPTRSLIFISASLIACSALATSFDCTKAKTETEQLICTDPELSLLDEKLSEAYKAALLQLNTKLLFKSSQRAWLNDIKQCKSAACLKTAFTERTALLNNVATEGSAAEWNGEYARYTNGKKNNATPANIVLLGLKDNRVFVHGFALGTYSSQGTHTGDINGLGDVRDAHASFSKDSCKVEITLKQTVLAIKDNDSCGGMGVTFTGTYKRQ
ncbi:lysozyme inhibitor LprI family protein [Chitinimonas sp. BJB300]|uniref:lysozyme inhibitor LprI family protein n=1 Tax=Chitinimonas sp. BJB300 TaxID=1559339 RepID=UPI000C0F2228|nr:lysozyme inhibitor LprI family protein [Chitinimonas sp. BJB300]PHV09673.1 hypothetical protein CSQ89_20415 [Chitinimonas sp. BJB300]TSJ85905.1 DUF1311 domain-containing protein [Chitinimonas sp. BJB300]